MNTSPHVGSNPERDGETATIATPSRGYTDAPPMTPPPIAPRTGHGDDPTSQVAVPPSTFGGSGDDPTSRVSVPPSSFSVRGSAHSRFHTPYLEPERAPERIGPYRVLGELGKGGMGMVYLAQRDDDQFRRRVAIKILKRGMDTEDILKRFELERQLLAGLNHPNIARLLDGGVTEDGRPFFAIEYIEGLPLDKYCDSRRLNVAERLRIFRQVCSAAHYAHQNLIIHRDIKPGNILVTKDGAPKLLDFGIAKLLNPDLSNAIQPVTQGDFRLMTPEYASPEQVRGEPLSTASDVYSLGVLLYELLTGHRPYRLRTRVQEELVRVICNSDPEKPSTAVSKVEEIASTTVLPSGERAPSTRTISPADVARSREGKIDRLRRKLQGDLDNIVLMAMRKEPQRRYVSAEALSEDLRRHMEGMPVQARPDSSWYRAAKFVRRNRVPVAAAAALALSITGGAAAFAWQADVAQEQRDVAAAQRDRAEAAADAMARLSDLLAGFYVDMDGYQTSVRRREALVTGALENLRTLEAEAAENPRLRRAIAGAYARVGDVLGGVRGPNLGRTDDALAAYRRAVEVGEQLLAADPADRLAQRGLIGARVRLGDLLIKSNDTQAALAQYRPAVEAAEALAAADPKDDAAQREWAVAALEYGDALRRSGDSAGASAMFERSLEIRRRLVAAEPLEPMRQRDLSVALTRVGESQRAQGDLIAARRTYAELISTRQAIAEKEPESARARRDLLLAQIWDADAAMAQGDYRGVLERLAPRLGDVREWRKADPTNNRTREDLMMTLERVGDAHAGLGEHEQAVERYREQRSLAEAVPGTAPTAAQVNVLIASSARIGTSLLTRGDVEGALPELRRAADLASGALAKDPSNISARRRLADASTSLGGGLALRDDFAGAEAAYTRALDVHAEMLQADPTNADHRDGVASASLLIGVLRLDDRNDPAGAEPFLRRSVELLQAPAGSPGAGAYTRAIYAEACAALSRLEAGRNNADAATDLAQRASAAAPRPTASVLRAVGLAKAASGDREGARATLTEALGMLADAPPASGRGRLRVQVQKNLDALP